MQFCVGKQGWRGRQVGGNLLEVEKNEIYDPVGREHGKKGKMLIKLRNIFVVSNAQRRN